MFLFVQHQNKAQFVFVRTPTLSTTTPQPHAAIIIS